MGFRNGRIGHPNDLLQTRAIVKKDNYALIVPDGLVKNQIPGFAACEITILSTPKLGAHFVDYLVSVAPGGGNTVGFGGNGIETFVYVLDGTLQASDGNKDFALSSGGFLFVPADRQMTFSNPTDAVTELFLYKRRYVPVEGLSAYTVSGNSNTVKSVDYEGMPDVQFSSFLPTDDLAFDMNFHILSFEPGSSHGYVETHVQEHGALILEGEGLYNLDNDWIPVKRDDYLFMASYCLQAGYGIGHDAPFRYLYSKDCNRDEAI